MYSLYMYKGILPKGDLNSSSSIQSFIQSTNQVRRRIPKNHFYCTVLLIRNSLLELTVVFTGMLLDSVCFYMLLRILVVK